ncbi:MAG TPA: hypothetical protein VKM35_11000 [Arenimonas sp.]|uniref:hypothetical protein n=1 Tax=Arenimonas sp. TaxID=1872635 RepID=UPI002BA50CBE|nr:hypothetical protein [Arenimonas sp.]HMB57722.1 hypothetical protein [Arenimonas sp.]
MSAVTPIAAPTATSTDILRDQFAGHIINALIIAPRQPGIARLDVDGMARSAYEYADAMLRARSP